MSEWKNWWIHTALVERHWFRWPFEAMRECGPAVQTLGGILAITAKSTFASADSIASRARLPLATVRKHLAALDEKGWIVNAGRGRTKTNRLRRTCTISVEKRTLEAAKAEYGVAPWWYSEKQLDLSWADRAVLSVCMANVMSLLKVAQEINDQAGGSDCGMLDVLYQFDEDRYTMPLRFLEEKTGLSRHSIVTAKRNLHQRGIVTNFASTGSNKAKGYTTSLLAPNWCFAVRTLDIGGGRMKVELMPNKDGSFWGKKHPFANG